MASSNLNIAWFEKITRHDGSALNRSHRRSTYEKWASQVGETFLFSVKLPRDITHNSRLNCIAEKLKQFCDEVAGLGQKLGCVLVQLPPSLEFSKPDAVSAFEALRQDFDCAIVCEPRHLSWFASDAKEVFTEMRVARAAVDPPLFPQANVPGGDQQTCYYRLHGSPKMYYSNYSDESLAGIARSIAEHAQTSKAWCIFDNTANGHATTSALTMKHQLPH